MSTPELRTRELLEDLRARIDVVTPPTAGLLRGGRRRRRSRHLALGVAAAVVAAMVASAGVALHRERPAVLTPVKVGLEAPSAGSGRTRCSRRLRRR